MTWIGISIAVLAALWIFVRLMQRRDALRRERARNRRCACGYIIDHLPEPRCPECGRAVGFDKRFDELGISQEELEEARRRKLLERKLRGRNANN